MGINSKKDHLMDSQVESVGSVLTSLAFWLGIITSFIASVVFALVVMATKGIQPTWTLIQSVLGLYSVLTSIRMTRFTRCRDDYSLFRKDAKTIDKYVMLSKKSLAMVSVSLPTAVRNHGMLDSISRLLNSSPPVEVTISMLDFQNNSLMSGIAPALDKTAEDLSAEIASCVGDLARFRKGLSAQARRHFHVRLHNAIPFASAILIDSSDSGGRIQIETKPFRRPLRDSFGFEIMHGGKHPFYNTILESYKELIDRGREILLTDVE